MQYSIFKYDFMYVWFCWEEKPEFLVKSVSISQNKPKLKGKPGTHIQAEKLQQQIIRYLDGKLEMVPIDRLDISGLTPFAKKVLCELRKKVKRGKTVSYGKLAQFAGKTGAARAVGSVMRNNPFPLILPCHRVIKSDGSVGLFQGTKAGGKLKQQLLELENGG